MQVVLTEEEALWLSLNGQGSNVSSSFPKWNTLVNNTTQDDWLISPSGGQNVSLLHFLIPIYLHTDLTALKLGKITFKNHAV